jgi:hypothetical protein
MWRLVATDLAKACAGGLGITMLLAAINAGTGGAWLFFLPDGRVHVDARSIALGDR